MFEVQIHSSFIAVNLRWKSLQYWRINGKKSEENCGTM